MIKSTRWYCKTEDARELKRLALELGDLNQEEAFGRAVAALRDAMMREKLVASMVRKPGEEQ